MSDELLPCPFCGGKARWTGRYVQCCDCDIRTDEYRIDYNNTAYAKATSAWNRRTEPVKHGKWIILDECSNEGVYCSVCSKKVYRTEYANQKLKSKYCPNCGAKMEVEP
jgi:hypothetical protein